MSIIPQGLFNKVFIILKIFQKYLFIRHRYHLTVHAFISSCLDCCNSLFLCLDQKSIDRLQTEENLACQASKAHDADTYSILYILCVIAYCNMCVPGGLKSISTGPNHRCPTPEYLGFCSIMATLEEITIGFGKIMAEKASRVCC